MNPQPWYRRMMNGQGGLFGAPVRGVLWTASLGYGLGVARRNARYDRDAHRVRLSVPVISIGNLTVGGTGKTPMVIDVVERLFSMGKSPAVVARGYGAGEEEVNDEQRLIQARCPGVIYAADPDRVAAGRRAVAQLGADVIVLDDGFQHRRLSRDLDVALVDATNPLGYDHLLPRGLLREPPSSLRRANLVVLTRCDQTSTADLQRTAHRIHEIVGRTPVLKCRHHVTSLRRLDGTAESSDLSGRRVVLWAGIANPRSFAVTVSNLGATVVGERCFSDHHRYTPADLARLVVAGKFPAFDAFVTTEKDAVKLARIPEAATLPILVVRIAIAFEGDGGVILQQMLESVVRRGTAKP